MLCVRGRYIRVCWLIVTKSLAACIELIEKVDSAQGLRSEIQCRQIAVLSHNQGFDSIPCKAILYLSRNFMYK